MGRQPNPFAPYPEDEEQRLIDTYILSKAKGGLQYAAETLDKPGRAMRGLLAGRPSELLNLVPFSDTLGLTDPAQSTSGRDLLEQYGVLDKNTPGLDVGDVAGFGAEVLTDPLSWIGGLGALTKTGRAAQASGKATKGVAAGIRSGERSLFNVGIPGGDLLGLNKRFGLENIPIGTGEGAAKFVETLAKPIDKLRWSKFGREAARNVDATLGNQSSKLGQESYKTNVLDPLMKESAEARKPLYQHAREMFKEGNFDEEHIKAMIGGAEGVIPPGAYTSHMLDPAGNMVSVPTSRELAAQTGRELRDSFKKMIPAEQRAGLATDELADDFIPYIARYHHSEQKGLLQGFAERHKEVAKFASASRIDELKNIPGGTTMIERLIQDPDMWDLPLDDAASKAMALTGGLDEGTHARDLVKWIRKQDRTNFHDLVPTTTPSGAVVNQWVPNGRRFFNADPITDAVTRFDRHTKHMKELDHIVDLAVKGSVKAADIPAEEIGNYVKLADTLDMPGTASRFGGVMGHATNGNSAWAMAAEGLEPRVARGLGENPHELLTRTAMAGSTPIKKFTVKGLSDRYVPKEIAGDMQRIVKAWDNPEELKFLGNLHDTLATMWKTTQTGLWPAFHSRNAIGGLFYHLASGAGGIHSKDTLNAAYAMRTGAEIDPAILAKLGYSSTQEAIADARAFGAMRSGANSFDDAMGVAAINEPSAAVLGSIGATKRGPLESIQDAWTRSYRAAKGGEGKWGKVRDTVDSIIDSSRRTGNFTEDIIRANQFFSRKMQGWTSEAAAMDVKKWYFNFDELTETERNIFRRVIPFYSWMRFNTPLVGKALLDRPGGPLAQTVRFATQGRQDQGYLPEHIGETTAIPTPFAGPGNFITGLGLPYESAFQPFKVAPTLSKTLQRTGESLLASATPPASFAYSIMSGREPYFGRELSDLYPYPFNNKLANLALAKTVGRPLSEYRKLTDDRKGWVPWAIGASTGIKLEDVSGGLERQQQLESKRVLGNILSESPRIKSFTNYYADPRQRGALTEDEERNLKLMAGLNKRGRDAAKKQKLTEQQAFLLNR